MNFFFFFFVVKIITVGKNIFVWQNCFYRRKLASTHSSMQPDIINANFPSQLSHAVPLRPLFKVYLCSKINGKPFSTRVRTSRHQSNVRPGALTMVSLKTSEIHLNISKTRIVRETRILSNLDLLWQVIYNCSFYQITRYLFKTHIYIVPLCFQYIRRMSRD